MASTPSIDTCHSLIPDLSLDALTGAESHTVASYESFLHAVVQTLRARGHHAFAATVDTAKGQWTAVACDSTDGYVIRTYGPYGGNDESWNEEPVHISRHNAVERFLRYLRHAPPKPLLAHLDTTAAYRELFAEEYRATCAVAVDGWWQARMSEGHTPESAHTLLALALPTHLQPRLTYASGTPTIS